MTFEQRILNIQGHIHELRGKLQALGTEIWTEVDAENFEELARAAAIQPRLMASVAQFEDTAGGLGNLVEQWRHGRDVPAVADRAAAPRLAGRPRRTPEPLPVASPPGNFGGDSIPEAVAARIQRTLKVRSVLGPKAVPDRSGPGRAVLLLAIARLIAAGEIATPEIVYNELIESAFRRILLGMGHAASEMDGVGAFWDLQRTKFWSLVPAPGSTRLLAATRRITSRGQLDRLVLHAQMDPDLFACLRDNRLSSLLQKSIIDDYLY